MNLFPLLLLAVCASATEPATVTLTRLGGGVKPIVYYNAAGVSRDLSLMAAVGEQSIGVWRLPDGRQVDRIPLPDVTREKDDLLEFRVLDFSPDGRSVLVSQARRLSNWERGEYALLLLSLADKKYKTLYKGRLGCHHIGEPGGMLSGMMDCPRVDTASFSPDGKFIAVRTFGYADSDLAFSAPYRPLLALAVLGVDGRVVKEIKGQIRLIEKGDPIRGIEPKWAPVEAGLTAASFGADGRLLGLAVDDAGCEVVDLLGGKSVTFLDSCSTKNPYPGIENGDRVFSQRDNEPQPNTKTITLTNWDALTGRRWADIVLPNTAHKTWGGARLFSLAGDNPRLEVRDGISGALVAVSSGMPTTLKYDFSVRALTASPDGKTLFVDEGGAFESFRLDFGETPPMEPAVGLAKPAKVDVDVAPTGAVADPNSYAVVIGVEKYRQAGIPAVDYAARDAKTMASYLTGAMGFDPKNVVLLTDERASKTDLEKHLGTWLKNRVGAKSRVFVYYAGHGSPNPTTGAGYLMPYEADPSYLDDTAYPLAKLYASLDALPTKDVTVVLDACFSGQGPRSLIAKGARPLVTAVAQKGPKRASVIAAAASNQISLSDPEAKHGLLTYYLLEGLHGAADANGDGLITPEEAFDYAKPAVERAARLQNQEQTPTASESLKADARPWITLKK